MSDEPRVFTEVELSLMKKLGLTPDKIASLGKAAEKQAKREARRKNECFLSEYYLKHISSCSLCGGKEITYFKMQKEFTADGSCLHSVRVSKEEFDTANKTSVKNDLHLTCKCCKENLMQHDKDVLVALCINLQKRTFK